VVEGDFQNGGQKIPNTARFGCLQKSKGEWKNMASLNDSNNQYKDNSYQNL